MNKKTIQLLSAASIIFIGCASKQEQIEIQALKHDGTTIPMFVSEEKLTMVSVHGKNPTDRVLVTLDKEGDVALANEEPISDSDFARIMEDFKKKHSKGFYLQAHRETSPERIKEVLGLMNRSDSREILMTYK